jgi:RHS repeat-associated protein
VIVDWPGKSMWPTMERKSTWYYTESWVGSLLLHSRDPSGQYYRRNRFYDGTSGRFTQEDPIGIAGGLNVYGYANGDPISYSDPYGLSATCDPPRPWCVAKVLGGVGAVGGGAVGAFGGASVGAATCSVTIVGTIPCGLGGAALGGAKGAAVGGGAGVLVGAAIDWGA